MLIRTCNSPDNGHEAIYNYEGKFIQKIELAKTLPNYELLEQYAQECLYHHTGFGLPSIIAIADMDKIIAMTDEQFLEEATVFISKHH